MVLSRLNNTIDYPDIRKVDEEDVGFNSALYSMDVYDTDIIIALGNIRYSFVTKGVLYVPMYLVVNDRVVSQIGVFECLNRDYTKLLDVDNDIDLNLLDYPLLYSFVTKEYIITLQGEKTEEEEVIERKKDAKRSVSFLEKKGGALPNPPAPQPSKEQKEKVKEE